MIRMIKNAPSCMTSDTNIAHPSVSRNTCIVYWIFARKYLTFLLVTVYCSSSLFWHWSSSVSSSEMSSEALFFDVLTKGNWNELLFIIGERFLPSEVEQLNFDMLRCIWKYNVWTSCLDLFFEKTNNAWKYTKPKNATDLQETPRPED